MYKPIIENEELNFKNLLSFLLGHLKQLIIYCIYLYIFIFISFFFGGGNYTSTTTFYTNYKSTSSLGTSSFTFPLSLNQNGLRFEIKDYINSDKFLDEICKKEFDFNGTQMTLVEKWGGDYNNYRKFLFSPHNMFLLWSANQMFTPDLSVENKKLHFAKTYLKAKINYSEDRKSDLNTLKVVLPGYPTLPKQILDEMIISIINFSGEISTIKSSEKISFLEQRENEVKSDLLNAENKLLDFLETNKNINSPNLRVQKERLERDVILLGQILFQVSLSIESEKVDLTDKSSSIIILDQAQVPARKDGMSLAKRLFYMTIFLGFVFYSYKILINRKSLIQ